MPSSLDQSMTDRISGVSTAPSLTSASIPTTILADTAAPPPVATPYAELTTGTLGSALSSLLESYTFPSILSYTAAPTEPSAGGQPTSYPAVPYFNSEGTLLLTQLPTSLLAPQASTLATTMTAPSGNATVTGTPGASPYNPNGAVPSMKVKKTGIAVAFLALMALSI